MCIYNLIKEYIIKNYALLNGLMCFMLNKELHLTCLCRSGCPLIGQSVYLMYLSVSIYLSIHVIIV